jgi:Ca2+-binding RTX toxin-like protein
MSFARWFRRQNKKRNEAAAKKRRKVLFEPLEPRLLLSADISTAGVAAVMDSGLGELKDDLNSFFAGESLLNTLVPLIVQQIKDVGPDGIDSDDIAPSISDLLDISLDLDQDGDVDADDITLGTTKLGVNITSLNAKDSDGDTYLELMDDILQPMLFDQISTILSGPLANDAAFVSALGGLDQSVTLGSLGFSFTVDGVSGTSNANQVSFELDLGITISQSLAFDLGTDADTNAISVAGDFSLPVIASLDIENLTLGVYTSGETPTNSDFFIDADTMDLSVSVGGILPAFDMSIGFLGVVVSGGSATLNADIDATFTDPTSAAKLGFSNSQFGVPQTSGQVVATQTLTAAAPTGFTSLFLRVGDSDMKEVRFDTASISESSIQAALNSSGVGSIIKASVSSDVLTLKLTSDPTTLDITPLGFSGNELFSASGVGVLEATTALTDTDAQNLTGTVDFLLSVDGALPKLVSVDVETLANVSALVAAIDAALSNAGISNVDADLNAGKVTISSTLGTPASLEVSKSLTLDSKISYSDLQPTSSYTDILPAFAQPGAIATVSLPVTVKTTGGFNYSGTNSTTINISTGTDIFSLTPPTADDEGNIRFALDLSSLDTDTVFQEMLQFNQISTGNVIGLFRQLGAWFGNYADTDFFAKYGTPFGDTTVNEILDFGDALSDALLIDDLDDGVDTTWTTKLLEFDAASNSLRPTFDTAQTLGSRLSSFLSGVSPSYDTSTDQLTYTLNLSNGFTEDVPVDFSLDLSPILDIESTGEVHLSANAGLTFTVGFDLGAASNITMASTLASLNRGTGVDIKTEPAITAPNTPTLIYGRLSEDAHFKVDGTDVTILKTDTDTNTTVADLVADINAKLPGGVTASAVGNRIKLSSSSAFTVTASDTDTAYREIGFRDSETATQKFGETAFTLTTGKDVPLIVGKLSNDTSDSGTADFTVTIDGTAYTVSVPLKDTVANRSIIDVINDVTNALKVAEKVSDSSIVDLTNTLAVSSQGLNLIISVKEEITSPPSSFSIETSDSDAQTGLGLGSTILNSDSYDLLIILSDNADPNSATQYRIDLDGAIGSDLNAIKTAIETQTSGDVTVGINDTGTGLKLTDNTFTGSSPGIFQVASLNGSSATLHLGILKGDIAVPTETKDGVIVGGPFGGTTLTDRFYINDGASVTGSLQLTMPTPVTADARFGFVGIELDSSGGTASDSFSASVTGSLKDPGSDGKITLTELQTAFSSSGNITDVINTPSYTGATGSFDFDVNVTPSILGMSNVGTLGVTITGMGNPFATTNYPDAQVTYKSGKIFEITGDVTNTLKPGMTSNATLTTGTVSSKIQSLSYDSSEDKTTITLVDSILDNTLTDVTVETPAAPNINVDATSLGDLDYFSDLSFDDLLGSLDTLIDFLQEFESSDIMGYELPIINRSVNDLVDYTDDLLAAVNSMKDNPATTLQDIENKINQAFGAGPSDDFITLSLITGTTDILKFSLNLDTGFNESVNVEIPNLLQIDLSDLGLGSTEWVNLSGSANLVASGNLDLTLAFGISLIDNASLELLGAAGYDPDLYIFEETGLSAGLTLAGTDLSFRASLGPLGLFVDGGEVSLSGTFGLGLDDDYGGFATSDRTLLFSSPIDTGYFDPSLTGTLDMDLPVFFPTEGRSAGSISLPTVTLDFLDLTSNPFADLLDTIDFSDLLDAIADFDLSSLNIFDNMLLAVDGIELFLDGLQYTLDSQIFGLLDLPIIGDGIERGADFISDLQKDFVDPFRNLVENADDLARDFGDPEKNIVSEFLYNTLNPTGLLSTSDIGTYEGFKGYYKDSKVGLSTNLDDYLFPEEGETPPNVKDTFVQWNVSIGDEYSLGKAFNFDLGLPGLGLDTEGAIDVSLGWDMDFGFGLSYADGFFIDIQDSNELTVWVTVEFEDGTAIAGTLGFLKLSAEVDETIDIDGDGGADETALGAAFAMNLANENDATDKKLGFTELGSIDLNPEIAAEAQAGLGLTLAFDGEVFGDSGKVFSGFPKLLAEFAFDWSVPGTTMNYTDPESSTFVKFADLTGGVGDVFKNSLNLVEFRDIELDLGTYISDVVGPIVEKVQEITGPVQPFIDVITTPIPVISDLGPDLTLLDIAAAYGNVDPTMIYAIADVISVINDIELAPGGDLLVSLGDMSIFDTTNNFTPELWDGNLNLGGAGGTFDNLLNSPDVAQLLSKAAEILDGTWLGNALDTVSGAAEDILNEIKFKEDGSAKGGGFSFPLLDNPTQALGLLMGRDAVLVAYDMPPLEFEFEYSQFFSIWGPLGVSINGELEINIDFGFGYDTYGIRNFIEGDFRNPLALFDGFYVSDTDLATGEFGTDVPELTFEGGLWAAAEINLGVARAGVGGGLFAEIDFNLFDPDHDGKVRIVELISNFENEWRYGSPALAPLAVFDVYGELYAKLFAFLKIDLFLFEIDKEWNITPEFTILDFEIPFTREPFLANESEPGVLLLNMGEFAKDRLNNDLTDFGETFTVTGDTNTLTVSATIGGNLFTKDYTTKSGTPWTKIVASGGKKGDTIDLSGVTDSSITYEIDGGAGDDTITLNNTKAGKAVIYGGPGTDTITAGPGDDIIYGQDGWDTIYGGDGKDLIFGDDGRLYNDATSPSLRARVGAADGNDTIRGQGGMDILIGGGGDDDIEGGGEQDFILGDGGKITFNSPMTADHIIAGGVADTERFINGGADTLKGGAGNDVIFGGCGDDWIYGEGDDDLLLGEAGTDWIYGGTEADTIYGDSGSPVTYAVGDLDLYTPTAVLDLWYEMKPGGSGETDYITGEAGADRIFGSGGNDSIFGDTGGDTIFGGSGADLIGGGADNDTIFGNAEPDTLYGGKGDDTLDGGDSSDILWGDEGPANLQDTAASPIAWNETVYGTNNPADYEYGKTYSDDPGGPGTHNDTLISGNGTDFLDGQWGSDDYEIYLQGGSNSNFINVYDSGNSSNQTDRMFVEGTMYDDTFLLRKSSSSSGLAFVALLNEEPNTERINYWSVAKEGPPSLTLGLERMLVSGLFGEDHFALDDVGTETTIEGNEDADTFQVGQLYNSPRDICASAYNNVEPEDVFATIETTVGWLSDGINRPTTIYGGTGEDYFTVFHNKAVLSLFGEDGDDTFLVKAFALAGSKEPIRERTDISGGAGVDLVQYAMNAPVNIDGGDGFDRVIIIGTEFGDDLVVTKDGVYGAGLNVNFVNVESLTVDMAEGDDRVYVRSTGEDMITEIFGGLGSDTFNMSGPTPPVISNDLRGHSGIVTHDIENTGTNYDETIIAGISANVADNDAADPVVVISEPDGNTEIFEGGKHDVYYVALSSQPSSTVTVQVYAPIQTKDQEERKAKMFQIYSPDEVTTPGSVTDDRTSISLEFDVTDWYKPKAVWVSAGEFNPVPPAPHEYPTLDYDDDAIEGDQTGFINHVVTTDLGIEGTPSHAPVVIDNVDPYEVTTEFYDTTMNFVDDYDDLAGYMLSITDGPGAGQSLRIKQVLENDKLLLWGKFRECDASEITPGESLYKITRDIEANRAITVLVHDNDIADVISTETDDSTIIFEGGTTDTIDVVLGREPDAKVTVNLASNDNQLIFSNSSLEFTAANYDSPQTVTVTAADDSIREGFHHGLISISSSSSDIDGTATATETIVLSKKQSYVGLMNRPSLVMTGDIGDYKVQSVTVNGDSDYNDSTYKMVDGTLKVDQPGDYYVTFNKIVFLKPNGEFDEVIGTIEVQYIYDTEGYNALEIKPVLTDISDNEVPQVLITESGGSTDVIEGTPPGAPNPDLWEDTYEVVLTRQPTSDVEIRVTPEITKTSAGRIIHWGKQVAVTSSASGAVQDGDDVILTFTTSNWNTAQQVKVTAIDDGVYDGDDTQVFAPEPHTISGIQGPLYLQGAGGNGSIVDFKPTMLHYETNYMPETGPAEANEDGTTITVAKQPLFDGAAEINKKINMMLNYDEEGNPLAPGEDPVFSDEEILDAVVSEMMTVTLANGHLMDSNGDPVDLNGDPVSEIEDYVFLEEIGQFRLIIDATLADDTVTLTLNEAWDLSESWDLSDDDYDSYDMITEYRITHMSENFFADETEQIDYVFVYNEDSQADNQTQWRQGLLTDSTTIGYAGNSIVEDFAAELCGKNLTGFGMATEDLMLAGFKHPRGITYGDMEVVEINLGDGIDEFLVEDTHTRPDGFQTWTIINTGEGDDNIIVNLDTNDPIIPEGIVSSTIPKTSNTLDGDFSGYGNLAGFVIEITSGQAIGTMREIISNTSSQLTVSSTWNSEIQSGTTYTIHNDYDGAVAINTEGGDDIVDGSNSTMPLIIFGGDNDTTGDILTGGSADDIIFGDEGRIEYVNEDGKIVTLLGLVRHKIDPQYIDGWTSNTLTDDDGNYPLQTIDIQGLEGLMVSITDGAGFRHDPRLIGANTVDTLTVSPDWEYDLKVPPPGYDPATDFNSTDPEANPSKYRISLIPEDQTDGVVRDPSLIIAINPTVGGADTIYGGAGEDQILGGAGGDEIHGGADDDTIIGDHGRMDFTPDTSAYTEEDPPGIGDTVPADLDRIRTTYDEHGGADTISGDADDDIIIGATDGDEIHGGADDDLVLGDFGAISYIDNVPRLLETKDFDDNDGVGSPPVLGGADTIYGDDGEDVLVGGDDDDNIDGGVDDDLILGDNVKLDREDQATFDDFTNPRYRTLTGSMIYGEVGADDSETMEDETDRLVPDLTGTPVWANWDIFINETDKYNAYGDDYIAGGGHDDTIFGQLGDDIIQGDGSIDGKIDDDEPVSASRDNDNLLVITPSFEDTTDGDDYIEGNAGRDVIFGNLGQDDIIGGSSELFSLTTPALRADSSDLIFGGAGTDIERNHYGDLPVGENENTLHARDADMILGDNGNIFRLVEVTGTTGDPKVDATQYLQFNYDQTSDYEDRGTLRIIPRAADLLDYTPGGLDVSPDAVNDIGAVDEIHGGPGDDFIYGTKGNDVLFGDSQDDDLIGGYGHDWISGGTGQDGVIGDDGRIYTSRNSEAGEPFYGVDGLLANDPRPKYADGNVLDEVIKTPGNIQYAVINKSNELKKTVNLTPFSFDNGWNGMDDEFPETAGDSPLADDIIFGGLDSDFLHGGSGDDAISGAEALDHAYVSVYDGNGDPTGVLDLGYLVAGVSNTNPGNVLAYNPVDVDGQHLNNRFRAGEFALYDEYLPLHKILLNNDGSLWDPETQDPPPNEFLLNFDETEGVVREGGDVPKATGQQTTTYPAVHDDGQDAVFGDLGNDWLVGGTGRDNLYGGWGNDLLNADDDHDGYDNDNELNDTPDTHPYYEDRTYGGAGRDVLIGNTGGDRLIDWVGEYNSYLVPYAPFGQASVSRTMQPFLQEFLYALSDGDGADPTRADDTGADPNRNGEPEAELGVVVQKDFAWKDQTGAPSDPQAGNIPGGARDVLRSSNFNDGTAGAMFADSGVWSVESGKLKVSAESIGGDAVSVMHLDDPLPTYFEITATITMEKPTGGWKANAYVIYDYYSTTDFKFAGIDASRDKIQLGHRTAEGWIIDAEIPSQIKPGQYYNVLVAVNGTNVTVRVDGTEYFSHTYEARVDADGWVYGINEGMVGLGSDNSRGTFDNIVVQVLPPDYTFQATEDFADTEAAFLTVPQSGDWQIAGGRYDGVPVGGDWAISLVELGARLRANSILDVEATVNTDATTGIVFDYYGPDDFKYAGLSAIGDTLVIGHFKSGKWVVDAGTDVDIEAGMDYELALSLKGTTVDVSLKAAGANNWQTMLGHVFNGVTVDGAFGLLAKEGTASFDTLTVRTDDPAFREDRDNLIASAAPQDAYGAESTLTYDSVVPIVEEALERWNESFLIDNSDLALLDEISFEIADLNDLILGQTTGTTVYIDADAAGHGWFVDPTPYDDSEFRRHGGNGELLAKPSSPAYGDMDLLTVVMHELGHVLGLEHTEQEGLMDAALDPGARYLADEADIAGDRGRAEESSTGLVLMELSQEPEDREGSVAAASDQKQNSWLYSFLLNGAGEDDASDPNGDIRVVIEEVTKVS